MSRLVELSREDQVKLFMKMGVLLLLDCPQAKISVDNCEWQPHPAFRGLKFVPPGAHLIHLQQPGHSLRLCQFFFVSELNRTHVLRWDQSKLRFSRLNREDEEAYRLGVDRFQFDGSLAVYPEGNKAWAFASRLIEAETLARLDGGELVIPGPEHELGHTVVTLGYSYSDLPPRVSKHLLPARRTIDNHDQTARLRTVLAGLPAESGPLSLLGQLQFSFLCFLYGHDYQSFEHWRQLVQLLCSCDSALEDPSMAKFWEAALQAIWACFISLPTDLRLQLIEEGGFLRAALGGLLLLLEDSRVPGASKFIAMLARQGVTREQSGQDAPQVLQTEDQPLTEEEWACD